MGCPLDRNLGAALADVEGSSASRPREYETEPKGFWRNGSCWPRGRFIKRRVRQASYGRGLKASRPRPLVGSPCDRLCSCCESEQPRGDPQRDPLLAAAAQLQPADSTRECRHHVCSNEDEKVEIMPTRRFSGANNAKLGPWWPHRLRGLGGSAAERPKWRALAGDLVWGSEEDHSRRIVAADGCFYCW